MANSIRRKKTERKFKEHFAFWGAENIFGVAISNFPELWIFNYQSNIYLIFKYFLKFFMKIEI